MNRFFSWLAKHKHAYLYTAAVLLLSLAVGSSVSLLQRNTYLPTLSGDISAITVTDETVLCVVSREQDSFLLRMDTGGTLLNYCRLDSDQGIERLAVSGEQIYAIKATYHDGKTTQKLVSFCLEEQSMTPRTILDLSGLPDERASDIVWQSLALTDNGSLLLGGTDTHGNGYSLSFDPETGGYQLEQPLQDADVLFFSLSGQKQLIWVSNSCQVHLERNGQQVRNLLDGQSTTPQQPFFCDQYGFLSDSITGDIYKIDADGSVELFRKGTDIIPHSNDTYDQYAAYTVYQNADGNLCVAGVFSSDDGVTIVGEEWSMDTLHLGRHRLMLFWQHSWPIALVALIILLLACLWFERILRSPRLSTRLTLFELLAAVILLVSVTAIQYRAYQSTLLDEAYQTLHLIGGSLALSLESDTRMTDQELDNIVRQMRNQIYAALAEEGKTYTLRVLRQTSDGPAIGYDNHIPAGYLLEDVESHSYVLAVDETFYSHTASIRMLREALSTNYLYCQTFQQGEQLCCVTVSLPRVILLEGQTRFFQRMAPILAVCILLFLLLLWKTRRLLAPLNSIRAALEEFYSSGGGNQMVLSDIPHTELYDIALVFNQLSLETKIQFNALKTTNLSYRKLVPNSMLHFLGKSSVSDLTAGETVAIDAALLILAPSQPDHENSRIMPLINDATEMIGAFDGIVIDHDEGLDSLTAFFADDETALACARAFITDHNFVTAAVLQESIEFGVFGGSHLLFPLALTPYMARRFDAIALMRRFGAKIIRCDSHTAGLRLLGWDDGRTFYEETVWRTPDWQSAWRNVDALWAQALELYRQHDFAAAMRKFAGILRAMPGDEAAHWYLFRCESFRDAAQKDVNTDLLQGWKDK